MKMHVGIFKQLVLLSLLICCLSFVAGYTDPGDMEILEEFKKGLKNPHLLRWPDHSGDPCGDSWPSVFCNGYRVTQIQVQNFGLIGTLPQNFNKLSKLSNLGLQGNKFYGKLPSFSGFSELVYAFLNNNDFDTIPSDFFHGLTQLQVLALDGNPLNRSGWQLPSDLQSSSQLRNLSLVDNNLVGPLPEFLANLPFLTNLKLSFNKFSGPIPSSYVNAPFQILWLNGMSLAGPIDIVASMISLKQLWLHDNQFTGIISPAIANCSALTDLLLHNNQLVGHIPQELTALPLKSLKLDSNKLTGAIPKFGNIDVSYRMNSFCQQVPGVPCAPEVDALLSFLADLGYPLILASDWSGNDPCNWFGIVCKSKKVSAINLTRLKLNGTLSPAVGQLNSLSTINLGGNNISGVVPDEYTELKSLNSLNLSENNISPPVPSFNKNVKLNLDGNELLTGGGGSSGSSSPKHGSSPNAPTPGSSSRSCLALWVIIVPLLAVLVLLLGLIWYTCVRKMKKGRVQAPPNDHARKKSDLNDKEVTTENTSGESSNDADSSQRQYSETRVFDSENQGGASVQDVRNWTNKFALKNELGRGGFGTVYKGELEDGTHVVVKRMELSILGDGGLAKFESEIAVLSQVMHRNLVSFMGHFVDENGRSLVYEYMSLGSLSRHLFQRKMCSNWTPLSWERRLNIALDVAKGVEYLHTFTQQTIIHQDLKSSNILLGHDFLAKVSNYGLAKLALDGDQCVPTKPVGSSGYMAPEYAEMGKVSTKMDVYSYGIVLMELVTGIPAFDDSRPMDKKYIAQWFLPIKSSKEMLKAIIDPAIEVDEETFENVCIIAELAGHCTSSNEFQRPEMAHIVSVLSPLVEKWKPTHDDEDECMETDRDQSLSQMVKIWQARDASGFYNSKTTDHKVSIRSASTGIVNSFHS